MDIDIGEVPWMTLADPYILLFLNMNSPMSGQPIRQKPSSIALNIPVSQQNTGARCRILHQHGLLEKHGRGTYSISKLGRRVVHGEIDAADLRDGDGSGKHYNGNT